MTDAQRDDECSFCRLAVRLSAAFDLSNTRCTRHRPPGDRLHIPLYKVRSSFVPVTFGPEETRPDPAGSS